jgi:hypothetical protein
MPGLSYDGNTVKSPPRRPQTTGVRSERGNNSANLKPVNRVVRLRPVHGYSVTKHDDSAAMLEKPCGDKEAKTVTGKKFVKIRKASFGSGTRPLACH